MHRLIKIIVTSVVLASVTILAYSTMSYPPQVDDPTELVVIKRGDFAYRSTGEYLRGTYAVDPPTVVVHFPKDFLIMKRQVSQAEYAECVSSGSCRPLDRAQRGATSPNLPAVGVSWADATAYAAWLSARTGHHYRLPSYAQWAFAAGSAYKEEEAIETSDPSNPALRWLAEYEREARRKTTEDTRPKTFGSYGISSTGLLDIAGTVWDWTDTCSSLQYIDKDSAPEQNCRIRVVAGRHRGYIADFIRDPRGGACSVGIPPSNLGFRLVRDPATDRLDRSTASEGA